jgi:hypothetical protein
MGRRVVFLAAIPALTLLVGCLPHEQERACADMARLDLPVRLGDFGDQGVLWPHGVHGAAHPEGHPGLDFNLSAADADLAVFAPITGEIVATTPEADNPGSSCLILDSACIQVNLCHIRMEVGLGQGSRVKRGQLLGKVAPVAGGGAYSLHLGTYVKSGDQQVCPADFLHPDTVRCRLGESLGGQSPAACGPSAGSDTWMTRSGYPESAARELTLLCADRTRQSFELPREASLCNARLPEATRRAIEACLGPGCAGVW